MSNTDLAAEAVRHPLLTDVAPAVTGKWLSYAKSAKIGVKHRFGPRRRSRTNPQRVVAESARRRWAAQGPVWAVPEESVDEGGGSVSVTVTVSGGDVTVSGGVVTVTVVGAKMVAPLSVRPEAAPGAGSIAA